MGVDTELYYPPRIKGTYDEMADKAKARCNGSREMRLKPCPVREKCLEYAIQVDELFGIWGGMSHRERNALVRKRHKAAKKDGIDCHPTCNVCAAEREAVTEDAAED